MFGMIRSNVTQKVCLLMIISPAIPTEPNGGNHTPAFERASATPEAHAATMRVTRGLAGIAFRVLQDDEFYGQVCSSSSSGRVRILTSNAGKKRVSSFSWKCCLRSVSLKFLAKCIHRNLGA